MDKRRFGIASDFKCELQSEFVPIFFGTNDDYEIAVSGEPKFYDIKIPAFEMTSRENPPKADIYFTKDDMDLIENAKEIRIFVKSGATIEIDVINKSRADILVNFCCTKFDDEYIYFGDRFWKEIIEISQFKKLLRLKEVHKYIGIKDFSKVRYMQDMDPFNPNFSVKSDKKIAGLFI